MRVEMVMPQMGESITEGTVLKWTKKVGDLVKRDENVLEISTDKVDSEIPSPAAGRIVELLAKEGETVPVGQVIAILETELETTSAAAPASAPAPAAATPVVSAPVMAAPPVLTPAAASVAVPPHSPAHSPSSDFISREISGRFFSPLVRAIARGEGVSMESLAALPGTGRAGRVTRDDLVRFLDARAAGGGTEARAAPPTAPIERMSVMGVGAPAGSRAIEAKPFESYPNFSVAETRPTADGRIDVVAMDTMRQKIAEHMVRSKATSPHVASVTEVDMTRVVRHRESWKAAFQAKHGFNLTYTTYLIDAAIRSLLDYPMMNSSIDGTQVLVKRYIHFGVAVALEGGLIVPVIRHAEEKNFLGLARALQDLSSRARSKQLKPDDVSGGTFTLTNMGSFGNLFGIPIINQPQVGILGAGAIVKRPVVIDEMIAIRDIMYLSLSYDHRVVDGALGGHFIERVRHHLEHGDLPAGF